MARTEKHFTIDVNGKSDFVSIERIKPAFYEPHFSLLTAIPHVINNPAATTTATEGLTCILSCNRLSCY